MCLTYAMRLALGGIFLISSYSKLQYPSIFTDTVVNYGLLPENLSRAYGIALPWVELFVGCSLVLGVFSRIVPLISILITASFIAANVNGILHPYIGDTCKCLGTLVSLSHPISLGIDFAMMLMSGWLLLQYDSSEFLSIGYLLRRFDRGLGKRQKFLLEKIGGIIMVALLMSLIVIVAPFN